MAYFLLSHGMGGGFGGANADVICEYADKIEAENDAYQLAREDYESYEGCHGIRSYNDILAEDFEGEENDEAEEIYEEELNGWIEYHAEEVYLDGNNVWRYSSSDKEVDTDDISINI